MRKIFYILLSFLLISNTLAQGYRILKHEVKVKGVDQIEEGMVIAPIIKNNVNKATVRAHDARAARNEFTYVESEHHVWLYNYTNIEKRYTYTYTLQLEDFMVQHTYYISIDPGASYEEGKYVRMRIKKPELGTYPVYAYTNVESGSDQIMAKDQGEFVVDR